MPSPYASHQCQKCGAPIGWLGRFMERWFAWAVGTHNCKPPMENPPKKKLVKRKRFLVLCHAGDDKSYFCTLNKEYDPKGVVLPNRTATTYEEGATVFKTKDGAEGAVNRTRAAITAAQQSAFPEWVKFKPLYEATQLEVVDIMREEDPDAPKEAAE